MVAYAKVSKYEIISTRIKHSAIERDFHLIMRKRKKEAASFVIENFNVSPILCINLMI